MRVSRKEMDSNHLRIVEGASRLIRKQGIESTSVDDVMSRAGLTHGGFYRHFDSKEALVSAALEESFNEAIKVIEDSYSNLGPKEGAESYYVHYLSQGHVKHPELGCPISALSTDVARSTPGVKATFSDGFRRAVDKLAEAPALLMLQPHVPCSRPAAIPQKQNRCDLLGALPDFPTHNSTHN
jgi:TetR/AcrR family transcriptional repressor of nem operon